FMLHLSAVLSLSAAHQQPCNKQTNVASLPESPFIQTMMQDLSGQYANNQQGQIPHQAVQTADQAAIEQVQAAQGQIEGQPDRDHGGASLAFVQMNPGQRIDQQWSTGGKQSMRDASA